MTPKNTYETSDDDVSTFWGDEMSVGARVGVARPDRSAVDGTVAEGTTVGVFSWAGTAGVAGCAVAVKAGIRTAEAVALGRAVGVDDATGKVGTLVRAAQI